MPTEPTSLSGTRNRSHSYQHSFNAQTGEKESIQFLWENSAWGRLERSKGKVMERANTFVGPLPTYSRREQIDEAIAVVDPFSTGAHLAKQVAAAGYKVVRIFSIWDSPVAALVEKGLVVEYCASLQFNDLNPNIEAAFAEVYFLHNFFTKNFLIIYLFIFLIIYLLLAYFKYSCSSLPCSCNYSRC